MLYPLVFIGASLAISLLAAKIFSIEAVLCVCIILLLCILMFWCLDKKKYSTVILCLITMLIGFGSYTYKYQTDVKPIEDIKNSDLVKVEGVITEIPVYQNGHFRYELDVVSMNSLGTKVNANAKVYLYTTEKINADYYSTVTFSDKIYFSGEDNEYLFGKGIYASFYSDSITVKGAPQKGTGYYILKAREYIINHINSYLDSDIGGIVKGITIGESSTVSDETQQNFMNCGGSHIMAVSGLHASLVSALIMFLLLFFGVHRKIAAILSVPAVFIFAGISGFNLSTLRSAIMFSVFALSVVVFRDYHPLTSLGAAVIVICLLNPFAIYDAGFLLSVTSVLGIMLIVPFMTDWFKEHLLIKSIPKLNRPWSYLYTSCWVSIACSLFSFPVSILYFDSFSLIAPITNLILVPMAMLVLSLSMLSVVLSLVPLFAYVSEILMYLSGFFASIIKETVDFFGRFEFSAVKTSVSYISLLPFALLMIFALFVFLGLKPANIKRAVAISLCVTVVFVATSAVFNYNIIEIYALNTEKGVCVVVTKGDEASVIGTGGDQNLYELEALLEQKGIVNIETLFLPDMTEENSSGAAKLIYGYNVKEVILGETQGENYADVMSVCVDGVTVRKINIGQYHYGSFMDLQKGDGFVRVNIGHNCFTIVNSSYNFEKDTLDGTPSLIILSNSNVDNIKSNTYDTAFILGDPNETYINFDFLKESGIDCYYTAGKGNLSAYVRNGGKLSVRKYYN